MVKYLESLHSYIIQGHSECHVFESVSRCSGGKVFKNCQHQVLVLLTMARMNPNLTPIGHFWIQICIKKGEHKRPCSSTAVFKTLALSLCS